jgi:hypothetical protein
MKTHRYRVRSFVRCLALAAAVGMSGGHWMLLQSIAWTRMIVVYSQHATLRTAIEETFDGKHPCPMCRMIEAGRQSSQPQQPQIRSAVVPDVDALFAKTFVFDSDPTAVPVIATTGTFHSARSDPPPVPPPRMSSSRA